MKSFKIVFASLAVAIFGLVLSSFAVKDYYANAFARVCYAYTPPLSSPPTPSALHKQNVKGQTNSIIRSEFATTSPGTGNWTLISPTPTGTPSSCNSGDYFCAVCFDNTQYSLADVVEDFLLPIYDANSAPNAIFQHNVDIDPDATKVITTYLKSTNTN